MIQQWWSITRATLSLLAFGAVTVTPAAWADQHAEAEAAAVRKFTVVNVLYEGDKMFVPSVLVAEQGDTVRIKVVNKIPGEPPNHGFAIPAFDVEEVVNSGETKTVEFVADKAGLFDVKCQLHPAHLSAQLIVRAGKKE